MSVEMSIEMRRDRIATTVLSNGERNFWAEIKGICSNKVEVSRNIDDLTEAENQRKRLDMQLARVALLGNATRRKPDNVSRQSFKSKMLQKYFISITNENIVRYQSI
jgi:hypothetical protein